MVQLTHSSPLAQSDQLHSAYKQLWLALQLQFDPLKYSLNPASSNLLLATLRSIKNSLVGSRPRKLLTISDKQILAELGILTAILEASHLDLHSINLKIEAAAIVGLLCIPQDQTVHALLRARLPTVLIESVSSLLLKTPIRTLLSLQTPTRQVEHHLLQTLLRSLSALYSIIQDVSSTPKWGYMTKSPERVHQPHARLAHKQPSSPITRISFQDDHVKFDMKGKSKAMLDAAEEISVDVPLHPEPDTLAQHLWLTSKPNELKEACEHAKALLLKYLVFGNTIIPLILAISPPPKPSTPEQPVNLSLCSIADLAVPCFQLIWLICKDTRRQLWLVRKLMEAEEESADQTCCLKALTEALKVWLNSQHDHAVECATRAIGALLSIHEPPHYSEDQALLKYLDQLIWGKTHIEDVATPSLQAWGVGWVLLTCRAREGSPILRAALATSIVGLVKHFPDIRLRILLLQIHNTIDLIDNVSHSINVRAEAAYALAHAVTISETLQLEATEARVVPVLKKLLDKASEQPVPYATPTIVTQNAMLRESAYLALASLMSTLDGPRQEVIDLDLLPTIVHSLQDESLLVKAAACQCCRALSRAISVLRTKLADEGAGSRLFELAFGGEGEDESDDEDEDAVEVQLKIVAMGALCNLVLDFSPMKQEVLSRNGVEKFVKLLKSTKYQSLRESALWGLKNMTFSSSTHLKSKVISNLGWEEIMRLLEDKNPSIQENVMSLLRNVVCGEIADIEIVFKQLSVGSGLASLLEERLSADSACMHAMGAGLRESIVLQTVYLISNLATGNESHKKFLLDRYRMMRSVFELLSHSNPEIKIGAIWCIINLTHFDERSKSKLSLRAINLFEGLGVIEKLEELRSIGASSFGNNHQQKSNRSRSDVRERAECALKQIMKRRKY